MEPVLEIKGVTKIFKEKKRKFYALTDINLDIKKGEILGLLGPNGAGKTTLMNVIIGLVMQDKGTVTIFGQSNTNPAVFEKMNGVCADSYFHWVLRPKEILNFFAKVYHIDKKTANSRIEELIELFEMQDILDTKFADLSTGERTRLAFAKALLNKPELLLLDEPTLGLDPPISIKIRKMIKKINEVEGVTILLTSHYMQEVEMLAHRVAFINKGKIIDVGEVEKVKTKHFNTYDLVIKPTEIKNRKVLTRLGFTIKDGHLYRTMKSSEDLSVILTGIHNAGIGVKDIKIKKPTLEDYFMKLSGKDGKSKT